VVNGSMKFASDLWSLANHDYAQSSRP